MTRPGDQCTPVERQRRFLLGALVFGEISSLIGCGVMVVLWKFDSAALQAAFACYFSIKQHALKAERPQ